MSYSVLFDLRPNVPQVRQHQKHRALTLLLAFASVACLMALPSMACASSSSNSHPTSPSANNTHSIAQAKAIFFRCEQEAELTIVSPADAQICSAAYEFYLKHAHNGDFSSFFLEWKSERAERITKEGKPTHGGY